MIINKLLVVIFTFINLNNVVESAKILAVFPLPSKSHVILGSALLNGLADRGHEVTMLSSYPLKNPPKNYKDIVIGQEETRKVYESNVMSNYGVNIKVIQLYSAMTQLGEAVYQDPNVQALIHSDEQFDVIIYLQSSIDSLLGLSHKSNASSIMFSVIGATQISSYTQGNPLPCSYVPHFSVEYSDEMDFWERTHNLFVNIVGYLYLHFWNEPVQRKLLREHFPEAPSLDTLRENIDLVFLNSHIAVDTIRPTFQNMIDIGGYYLKQTEELPEDIKTFLDKSQYGVILFSFGSNLKSTNLDMNLINQFLEYFSQSLYDVLWNFDIDLSNKSSNVKIVNWLPQRSVLGHKNVKIFITHGGKGSVNEAIYHGVPMIIIPFYNDQQANAENAVRMEIAVKIDLMDVNCKRLQTSAMEIESNAKYRRNIEQRSRLFKNQVVDPMDKAIYWTEFVINNRGAKFFKSPAAALSWYQLILLDVVSFAFLILVITIVGVYYISKLIWGYILITIKRDKNPKKKIS